MKYRRNFISILVLVLTAPSFCVPFSNSVNNVMIYSDAADAALDPGIQYENCGDHVEITEYSGNRYCFEIPETIEELPVTKILAGAFRGRNFTEVYLSATIEEIGDSAFEGCTNLKEVHCSPVLQTIGNRAFFGCSNLSIMILPDTVSEIGAEAFAGCKALKNVILPDRIRTIRRRTFADNTALNTISIPGGIDRIENSAFQGCDALNTVCYKGSVDAWSVLSTGSGNDGLTSATVLCDYNKQKVERSRSFVPEKDSWSFMNKDVAYYLLSDEKLEDLTKGMSQQEKDNTIRQWNLKKEKEYTGSCAGIAMTSLLVSAGILDPSELDPDAECLHDVELTDEVRELITYYWLMQSSDSVFEGDIWSDFKLYYYLEQGLPVYFSYQAIGMDEEGHTNPIGHAVVAYGVEDGRFEFDGYVFTKRILTYDSNVSEENGRDGSIYWGVDNETAENVFPEYCVYVPYMAERGAVQIMPNPMSYSVDALNLHGLNKAVDYVEPEQKCALLRSNGLTENFRLMSYPSASPENKTNADYTAGKTGDFRTFQCTDSTMGYTLEMQEKQTLDCSMSYENVLYTVNSSQVTSASFEPDSAVSICGEDMQYELTMIADQHPTRYYELHISGKNADEVSVRQTDGGYVITGTDLHDVTIEALNDSKEISLTFTTDTGQVLVHETACNTLAVSADLDGDGFYETQLISDVALDLGDVNGDGSINAKDANEVLITAAKIGTGQDHGLTAAQQEAADVDGNGAINAEDATWILRYAAMSGTDTTQDSLETFIALFKS